MPERPGILLSMRHFRISFSLPAALLVTVCASRTLSGADAEASLLEKLGPEDDYLIVWVISADRKHEIWLEDLLSTKAWRGAAGTRPSTALHAEKNPSFLIRFGVSSLPVCLVLDPAGREVGRIRAGELDRATGPALSGRLSELLIAADASRRYRDGVDVRDGDPSRLFWLGQYHWNREERFKAIRWFEEYAALPAGDGDGDPELKARALYRLGEHALDTENPGRAAALFAEALGWTQDAERAARCALARARSLRKLGQHDEAIRSIEAQLGTQRTSRLHDRLLFSLGYLHMDLGNLERARKFFFECTTSFPKSAYSRKSAHYLREISVSPRSAPER